MTTGSGPLRLIIANKLYSSWSMRPWLVLKAFGIPFDETVIPLRQPDTRERLLAHSPAGKVPILIDGDIVIWDSLAIIEHISEKFSDHAIWPSAWAARAHARSISAEMHSGFQALRQTCPVNLGKRFKTPEMTNNLSEAVGRIEQIWFEARANFGGEGAYLFGAFSAADAMFAPVVTRFDTYEIPVSDMSRAYMDTMLAHRAFLDWKKAALCEPWTISDYETGHTPIEDYRQTS